MNSDALQNVLSEELRTDPNEDQARFQFTRNLTLYVAITQMRSRGRFANEFPEDIVPFERRMADYFASSVGFFALSRQLSLRHLDAAIEAREDFKRMSNAAFDVILEMLARQLLFGCSGEGEVAQRLNGLGFGIEIPSPVRMPLNLLALDAVGVLALFVLSTFFVPDQMPMVTAISIGLLVASNHVIAGTAALLPKQIWCFADIRCTHERPFLAYLISAISALTITLPLSYGFYLLRSTVFQPDVAIVSFAAQCKWLLLPTVLAFALAFVCDDYAGDERDPAWLRWAEGAMLGMILAFAGILVMRWLLPDQQEIHPNGHIPSLLVPVAMSAAIGVLFGTTIPTWYRATIRGTGAAAAHWPVLPHPATT